MMRPLEQQADSWRAVYELCCTLGMRSKSLSRITGKEQVLQFIRSLRANSFYKEPIDTISVRDGISQTIHPGLEDGEYAIFRIDLPRPRD